MNWLPENPRALAATARIANIPSVAGNVFLGIALAEWIRHPAPHHAVPVSVLPILSGICLYVAGNFLNDWADRNWDEIHRPERALPRRLFAPRTYLGTATGFGLLGLCCAAAASVQSLIVALFIGVSILVYTWAHKRAAWSVVPMGLCRALLPALGFSGFAPSSGFPPVLHACAFGIFLHIVGLSLSARAESKAATQAGSLHSAWILFPAAALSMVLASVRGFSLPPVASITGALPYLVWIALCLTVFRKTVHAHVSNLLAGIPLVDWIVLLPLALSVSASGPFSIACMLVPPLMLLSGRALQRLAPAT